MRWFISINEPSGLLLRWRLRLAEFDYAVDYKKVKVNAQADALSFLETEDESISVDEDDGVIPYFTLQKDGQKLDLVSDEICDDVLG